MEDTNALVKNITITGPESSGKSTLAAALASALPAVLVPEYSRTYLERLDRPYAKEDITAISRGQLSLEIEKKEQAQEYLICDTGQLVLKIWMEYKYGYVSPEIEYAFIHHPVDLYILCQADIPWEPDPMRENPHDRHVLFELYQKALIEYEKSFVVIDGADWDLRLSKAIAAIQKIT